VTAARLCVVRHGETAWNAEGRVQGQLDIPLSDAGRAQARHVARALPPGRFQAIYSSDLGRVVETARPSAERLGLAPQLDARLRERHYGVFQGLLYAEAKVKLPEDYRRFRERDPAYDFRGGESLAAFFARSIAALEAIAARHAGGEVLVFTHGGVLEMAYRHARALGLSGRRDFESPNAALNWIDVGGEGWRVLAWAERDHLEAALDDLP
jgi:probable phosphoglycerate mutase